MIILNTLSNRDLFLLCKRYGLQALEWRRKFMGLLPEVNRRRLYEKKGFGSIFEFAARLAGVSEEQVRRVLNLDCAFDSLPVLRGLLVEGVVSASKLARVTSVVDAENEGFWAEQVKNLSTRALETLVRDVKIAQRSVEVGVFAEVGGEGLFGGGVGGERGEWCGSGAVGVGGGVVDGVRGEGCGVGSGVVGEGGVGGGVGRVGSGVGLAGEVDGGIRSGVGLFYGLVGKVDGGANPGIGTDFDLENIQRNEIQNGFAEPENGGKSVRAHTKREESLLAVKSCEGASRWGGGSADERFSGRKEENVDDVSRVNGRGSIYGGSHDSGGFENAQEGVYVGRQEDAQKGVYAGAQEGSMKGARSVAELVSILNELELDEDVLEHLVDLKRRGLDVNDILRTLLARRMEEIEAEKERIGESLMGGGVKVGEGRPLGEDNVEDDGGQVVEADVCKKGEEVCNGVAEGKIMGEVGAKMKGESVAGGVFEGKLDCEIGADKKEESVVGGVFEGKIMGEVRVAKEAGKVDGFLSGLGEESDRSMKIARGIDFVRRIGLFGNDGVEKIGGLKQSRYIPVEVRKVLRKEYGTKCSIPHCGKPARDLHHTRRFALSGVHDPRYIAPLCEEHHKIAHLVDGVYARRAGAGTV